MTEKAKEERIIQEARKGYTIWKADRALKELHQALREEAVPRDVLADILRAAATIRREPLRLVVESPLHEEFLARINDHRALEAVEELRL